MVPLDMLLLIHISFPGRTSRSWCRPASTSDWTARPRSWMSRPPPPANSTHLPQHLTSAMPTHYTHSLPKLVSPETCPKRTKTEMVEKSPRNLLMFVAICVTGLAILEMFVLLQTSGGCESCDKKFRSVPFEGATISVPEILLMERM